MNKYYDVFRVNSLGSEELWYECCESIEEAKKLIEGNNTGTFIIYEVVRTKNQVETIYHFKEDNSSSKANDALPDIFSKNYYKSDDVD